MIEFLDSLWLWGDGIFSTACFALLTLIALWLLSSIINKKVFSFIDKKFIDEKHPFINRLSKGFRTPVTVFLKLLGLCIALLILSDLAGNPAVPVMLARVLKALPPILNKTLRISIVIMITWGLVSSSDVTSLLLRKARHKLDLQMSKSVSRFMGAVSNVVVVAIAVVIVLKEFSYDINGLVAGLGLGGLTVALAAKDSASNFFGGLVLVFEKPFEIGDWIVCQSVEGAVEDINLRSTKIRTAAGSLTIMPNATLASSPITNWGGGMEKRRADFSLNIQYGAIRSNLREFTSAIQTMLETDPDIINDSVVVRLAELADSSLAVRVIFYTSMPGFADHLRVRERVNYSLLDLAAKCGVAFAYPAQTIFLNDERKSSPSDCPAP